MHPPICQCSEIICHYVKNPELCTSKEKLVPLSCPWFEGSKELILSAMCLNEREILITNTNTSLNPATCSREKIEIKKIIVDHNLQCQENLILCPKLKTENSGFVLTEMDSKNFIYYHCGRNKVFSCCALTGQIKNLIVMAQNKIIHQVKYLDGIVFIKYIKDNDTSHGSDIDCYSLEDEKLISECILSKEFKFQIKDQEVILQTLNRSNYVITFIVQTTCKGNENSYLTLWKLNASKSSKDTFLSSKSTVIRKYYSEYNIDIIESDYDCFLLALASCVELYKVINDEIVLIKKICIILHSSQLTTLSIIPLQNQYNVITIQMVYLRRPLRCQILVTHRNLLSNKSCQILDHDPYQCDLPMPSPGTDMHVFLHRNSTLLFLNETSYKLKLDNKILGQLFHDIRKYARVLAQAYRTKTSLFCTLPLELVLDIICKTRNNYHKNKSEMMRIALQYF